MPAKVLKRVVLLIFLCAGLAGWLWHALKPPYDAVAQTQAAPPPAFQGGSGDTPATAVIIAGAPDYVAVVDGEYLYLGKKFGKQDRDWQVVKKEVYQHEAQVYDVITIQFPNDVRQQVFFDISKYFKKP
jgi:hypothetical protein